MVKIRLRRVGTKGRPFYRVVVAHSTAARNGNFVEAIGTYDPQAQPKHVAINEDRALHWLVQGAQPTETIAYLLNKLGVLERYFEQRPKARAQYSFLDKRTAAISVPSAIGDSPGKGKKEKAEPAEASNVVTDPVSEPVTEAVEDQPVETPTAGPEEEAATSEAEEPAAEASAPGETGEQTPEVSEEPAEEGAPAEASVEDGESTEASEEKPE